MTEIIRTEQLSKHFGSVKAVTDLSLSIRKGEIYGFLGLNGAGKTTTIRMLLGMINPSSGDCFIDGKRIIPGETETWKKLGYIVEIPYAYPDLTVRENLDLIRKLRGLKDKSTVGNIIDRLQLGEYTDRKARHLSQGNAQRLGLAKALIHQPEILLLDEPTNGLDPAGIVEIRELLVEMAASKGVTVFISSHILGEISRIANRIGIIHQGKLLLETDSAQLESSRLKKLILNTKDNRLAGEYIRNKFGAEVLFEGDEIVISDPHLICAPDELATFLVQNGLPPLKLFVYVEDLESFFLRTIGINNHPVNEKHT
jgi:ABC-2 type transport system ATP-binding protein